jgi:hypothetical protein
MAQAGRDLCSGRAAMDYMPHLPSPMHCDDELRNNADGSNVKSRAITLSRERFIIRYYFGRPRSSTILRLRPWAASEHELLAPRARRPQATSWQPLPRERTAGRYFEMTITSKIWCLVVCPAIKIVLMVATGASLGERYGSCARRSLGIAPRVSERHQRG